MEIVLDKVCAFITREKDARRELLVFEHKYPPSGVQIPAGTVEPGEEFDLAVLRETYEESGLEAVRIIQALGTFSFDLPEGQYALFQATSLLQDPSLDAQPCDLGYDQGTIINRGTYVKLEEMRGEWARVTYGDYDWRSDPPGPLKVVSGWVPIQRLVSRLIRHMFHLEVLEAVPDTWEHFAENKYTFCFYWVPLVPKPSMEGWHKLWLDSVYDRLL